MELVSVFYKPARTAAHEPVPIQPKPADEWAANAQPAAPAHETDARHIAAPKHILHGRAPQHVRHAKAVPRQNPQVYVPQGRPCQLRTEPPLPAWRAGMIWRAATASESQPNRSHKLNCGHAVLPELHP